MMKPKLYAFHTEDQRCLYEDYLLPSAKREFKVHVTTDKGAGGNWGSKAFGKASQLKSEMIYKAVCDNQGEVIVYSDVDVIMIRPVYQELLIYLGDFASLVASPSRVNQSKINTGFMVIRCTPEMQQFFKTVMQQDKSRAGRHDQFHTNELIRAKKLKRPPKMLPIQYFHNGLRGSMVNAKIKLPERPRIFHATYHHGLEAKIKALDTVKQQIGQTW
jgi:hypothetical protein